MNKIKLLTIVTLVFSLIGLSLLTVPGAAQAKTFYVGGSFALTGAYAEDTAAALAAYQDYVQYVNDTKMLAPWRKEKFPADVTLELMWRDDELKPPKALSIYEELKGKGMKVFRVGGSPQALALKDRLNDDHMASTSMAAGAYLMSPPGTIFAIYPLYTDGAGATAEWFIKNWHQNRKPRFAYFTSDTGFGRSVIVPECTDYIKSLGFEYVGEQFASLVVTSPPTTQLLWLKKNQVDLTFGAMINPGSQPTIKEAVRLGMGPYLDYKITFGFPSPNNLPQFTRDMGELGNGVIIAGSFPDWDRPDPGVKFGTELQKKYHPDKWVIHNIYFQGLVEVMTQVEALRLSLQKVPFEKLKSEDILEGFYQIKNFDTGGVANSLITYGPGDIEGTDMVRLDQVQKGKQVRLGEYPARHLYKH